MAKICHSLPCSIDHSGRASVDTYFRPEPFSDGQHHQAATFRGRGLLARQSSRVTGLVLNGDGQLKGSFDELVEWHHTHQIEEIPSQGRIQTAKDWMKVSAALHAPIGMQTTSG